MPEKYSEMFLFPNNPTKRDRPNEIIGNISSILFIKEIPS